MGKLYDNLQKQLKTEYKKEAEDCIKIYNKLREMNNGHVWQSQWESLVNVVKFMGTYPHSFAIYEPNGMGEVFLKGIYAKPIIPRSKGQRRN